jgi:branched-subunit amino acid aminotransferase/4-amino-4-deoxychorismate lyase
MSDARQGCICVNGSFFDPEAAMVSVLDAGFLLGDGLFESLRASQGVPYLLDRHLMRLYSAAAEFEFANMPRRETVTEQVYRTLQRSALLDAYVRVTITRGCGAVGLAPPEGPPTIVIVALPASVRPCPEDGLDATLLERRRDSRAKAKSTSWQQAVIARRSVERIGAGEGIYVSESGHVLEGVSSNIFMVEKNRLLTPHVSECLPGVTRARLLELAQGAGLTTVEASLEVDALMGADEVFVTNAVQGLRAINSIDGAQIDSPGSESIFTTLLDLYLEDRGAMQGAAR